MGLRGPILALLCMMWMMWNHFIITRTLFAFDRGSKFYDRGETVGTFGLSMFREFYGVSLSFGRNDTIEDGFCSPQGTSASSSFFCASLDGGENDTIEDSLVLSPRPTTGPFLFGANISSSFDAVSFGANISPTIWRFDAVSFGANISPTIWHPIPVAKLIRKLFVRTPAATPAPPRTRSFFILARLVSRSPSPTVWPASFFTEGHSAGCSIPGPIRVQHPFRWYRLEPRALKNRAHLACIKCQPKNCTRKIRRVLQKFREEKKSKDRQQKLAAAASASAAAATSAAPATAAAKVIV
jgi:hypothetical protein